MVVKAEGFPYWVRAAGHEQYGGNVNKRNHLTQGAIDPETDVTAQQLARLASDVASLARVAPFAQFQIQCNDSSPAAPTVVTGQTAVAVAVNGYEGDNPPSGMPTLARVSDGVFDITFDASYEDPYGTTGTFAVKAAIASADSGGSAVIDPQSETTLRIRATNNSGIPVADSIVSLIIHSGGP